MSKTIEERATIYATEYKEASCDNEYQLAKSVGMKIGYVAGAKEQRAIDEEELKSKWIAVEDRLPSYDKHYVNMLVYSAASFMAYYDGCKWWVCGPEQMEIKPSHWMPLPEEPSK